MINTVIFSDEITVWWDKQWELPDGVLYRATLGDTVIETVYTHATFADLTPETAYTLKIERMEDGIAVECLGVLPLSTPAAKRRIDVTAAPYFAIGDGATVNTAALQAAINDCGEGDCVYFPKGDFLTGALDLHSDMEIYLEEGATLRGTATLEDYLPRILSRFEGIEGMCYRSVLNMGTLDHSAGPNCKNIVLRGKGSILGGGAEHATAIIESEKARLKEFLEANADYVKTCENDSTIPGRVRSRLLHIANCENIVIAGLTLGYAASWNVHFIYSKNIVTYGCRILSRGVWNGDGWDPDSSEDCVIFDTHFETHDNSIAIKSGKNPEGNIIGRPTVGVRIFHCDGGQCMAVGSEMSGGVSDVYIWDCDFTDSNAGIGLKVTDKRGAYIRNVRVRNCRFVNLRARRVTFNDDGEPGPTIPIVEDVLFENVEFTGISVSPDGTKRPTDVLFIAGPEDEAHYFNRFTFDGVKLPCREGNAMTLLSLRNVKNLTVKNLTFFTEK